MKVYLDSSVLNRIFDNQAQARIYYEATAMLLVFELIEQSQIEIVSSEALEYELRRNPYTERRVFISTVLGLAKEFQKVDPKIITRAEQFERAGIKALDALHLASAESANADVFITCDDKLIKNHVAAVLAVSPPQFIVDLMKEK